MKNRKIVISLAVLIILAACITGLLAGIGNTGWDLKISSNVKQEYASTENFVLYQLEVYDGLRFFSNTIIYPCMDSIALFEEETYEKEYFPTDPFTGEIKEANPSLKYRNEYQNDGNTSMSFIFTFDNLESDGHIIDGRFQLSQSICDYETTLEYRFDKMLIESDDDSIFINGIVSIPENGDMTFSENFMFIYNGTRYTGDALLLDEWEYLLG